MKKIFKNWTKFEISFLFISIFTICGCYIMQSDKNIFSLIVSILGVITVLCASKGLVIGSVFNLIYSIIYLILSLTQQYYGEIILYIFYMIPMNIITIISWYKNKYKDNESYVEITTINKKDYIFLVITTFIFSIIFYFILDALHTNELLFSTLSLIGTYVATYLYYKRCSNYALGYIFNDIILICLWGLTIKYNLEYLPMIITFIVFFLNDIYGFINWKKMEKTQKGE